MTRSMFYHTILCSGRVFTIKAMASSEGHRRNSLVRHEFMLLDMVELSYVTVLGIFGYSHELANTYTAL